MRKFNFFLKRAFDIIVSLIAIIMLTVIPVFIVVPILIKLDSKGPAMYNMPRAGKDGKLFKMYKFRTMITERYDKDGNEIMSENRITKIGRFLRKTSIDELPQLFNILNGTMSIVGPRPMLDYQVERCEGEESLRFAVRPGMTGLAQAMGRNNLSWPERIQYDIKYVKEFTFLLDIKIIFLTALAVLKHTGTDVKPEYRGVDRFSKYYVPEKEKEPTK